MALAVVREQRTPRTDEELADYETDLLAVGFQKSATYAEQQPSLPTWIEALVPDN